MTIATASSDRRANPEHPVARLQFAQMEWDTGDGHAAKTADLYVNGTIERMDIIISSVTDNPTVTFTFADENGVAFGTELDQATLADGTNHHFHALSNKASQDADFNPVVHNGTITVTADPSADAGGSSQTLTVDVVLYVR